MAEEETVGAPSLNFRFGSIPACRCSLNPMFDNFGESAYGGTHHGSAEWFTAFSFEFAFHTKSGTEAAFV